MSKVKTLPVREKVKPADTWDLSSLFKEDGSWEKAFKKWEKQIPGYEKFRGHLGDSAEMLAACLQFDTAIERAGENLGTYAYLKASEDQGNSEYQRMKGRFGHASTLAGEASSFIRPELMSIPAEKMAGFMEAREMAPWKLALERILRYRPHTLSPESENLLAMQGQMSEASNQAFRQLNDADLKWGAVKDGKGQLVELGHSAFSTLLQSPSNKVRRDAFHEYYSQYEVHKNTLAATLNASNQRDVYYARARKFATAREAALFGDRVPVSVYDSLIEAVHNHLPTVYRYLELRRKKLKLKEIHHYDTYVPIIADVEKRHTWDRAVKMVIESLAPLGTEYTRELERGLTADRWCDRYPNKGKQSGAFSSGSYDGYPYILMNYEPDVLHGVFTLAHEAGHSMHSWYSAKTQPYQYWQYTIFVAEVASTFNEMLLGRHMMENAKDERERAYLISRQIDDIRGTIIRQTMFAEFEKISHALVEAGEPLTVDTLRREYRKLLELYFGPDFAIDKELELESLRIPHFYRAFYVYKYATGLSAAIALSERVVHGGKAELDAYLNFLRGGSSKYPLELLRDAGVDMEKPEPVDLALRRFGELVGQLEEML